MIVLIAATWTTNTDNAYAGGLSAVMVFHLKDEMRAAATLVTGVLGTNLAMAGFADLQGVIGSMVLYVLIMAVTEKKSKAAAGSR